MAQQLVYNHRLLAEGHLTNCTELPLLELKKPFSQHAKPRFEMAAGQSTSALKLALQFEGSGSSQGEFATREPAIC